MAKKKRYNPKLIEVQFEGQKKATWGRAGGNAIKGTEYYYAVKDGNFDRFNMWLFVILLYSQCSLLLKSPGLTSKEGQSFYPGQQKILIAHMHTVKYILPIPRGIKIG